MYPVISSWYLPHLNWPLPRSRHIVPGLSSIGVLRILSGPPSLGSETIEPLALLNAYPYALKSATAADNKAEKRNEKALVSKKSLH